MALLTHEKSEILQAHRRHEKDTGSPEVQVGLLTRRINSLTEHFKKNPKDHHSRRGLFVLVSQRRRMLDYVRKTDIERYRGILAAFGLRK
jgi:small subunit ribosomal protein S15